MMGLVRQINNSDRESVIAFVLSTIKKFSDKEYQRLNWRGEPGLCLYEDDSIDFYWEWHGVVNKYSEFGFSEKQRDILLKFGRIWRSFDESPYVLPEEWLESKEWNQVVVSAKECLEYFPALKAPDSPILS